MVASQLMKYLSKFRTQLQLLFIDTTVTVEVKSGDDRATIIIGIIVAVAVIGLIIIIIIAISYYLKHHQGHKSHRKYI